MLTAIGRAAARRVMAPASSKLLVAGAFHRRMVGLSVCSFAVSTRVQSPTAKATASKPKATLKSKAVKAKAKPKPKPKPKAKAKAKAKAKPKARKAKPKKKAVKKSGKPKKKPVPLTPQQKERVALSFLKRLTLISSMPTNLPARSWVVYMAKNSAKGVSSVEASKALSAKFKQLPESEKKAYQDEAARNRKHNVEQLKAWVQSHPPEAIHSANLARRRMAHKLGKKRYHTKIPDSRIPSRPISGFIQYSVKRRGDDQGMQGRTIADVSSQLKGEWASLSEAEKDKYKAKGREDMERFKRQFAILRGKIDTYIKNEKEAFKQSRAKKAATA